MLPTFRPFGSRCFAVLAAGLVLLASWQAEASLIFPSEVQKELDMPCAPGCTLCHTTQLGQSGTAVTPFALKLRAVPIGGGDEKALIAALKAAEAAQIDADEDTRPDIDELRKGLDPNTKDADARVCGPAYGCGARISKAPPQDMTAIAVSVGALLLVALGLRRRR